MPNLQGRFALPHLLGELEIERSAAAIIALRNDLKKTRPSDGTVRKIAYQYGLVRQEAIAQLLSILNFHLAKKGIREVANNNIVEFNSYIQELGPCLNYLESIRNADTSAGEGPVGAISAASGYRVEVIESMRKKNLVPQKVAEAVLGAARTVCGMFNYTHNNLRIQFAPVHLLDMKPIPVEGGRAYIFEKIAEHQI